MNKAGNMIRLPLLLVLAPLVVSQACARDTLGSDRDNEGVNVAQNECVVDSDCGESESSCKIIRCNDGTCETRINKGDSCDDGDACTTGDICNAKGRCVAEATQPEAPTQCQVEGSASCDPDTGIWTYTVNTGEACDDGSACTTGDTCGSDGACTGSEIAVPSPGPCEDPDSLECGESGWEYSVAVGASCDDGFACNTNDTCQADGSCQGESVAPPAPTQCEDPDSLTCTPTGWAYSVNTGGACSDGNSCTIGDACLADGSCMGTEIPRPSANQCEDPDSIMCVNGAWEYNPLTGQACSDGNNCTTDDTCNSNAACVGTPVVCDAAPFCRTEDGATCDENGGCIYPADVGAACDDGDICTNADACDSSAECTGGVTGPIGVGGACGPKVLGSGYRHTCGIDTAHRTGNLQCWGWNKYRQLGSSQNNEMDIARNVVGLPGDSPVVQVDGGHDHSCAMLEDGRVYCWGRGQYLGQGGPAGSNSIKQVPGIDDARALSVHDGHSCVIRSDGSIWCWGANTNGQLGTGDQEWGWSPRPVEGITNARYIGAGRSHRCAITADDELWCWGSNGRNEPGEGYFTYTSTGSPAFYTSPVLVPAPSGLREVEGGNQGTCVLTENDGVWCRGYAETLGFPGSSGSYPFSQIPGTTDFETMSVAAYAGCGITSSSRVKCWGDTGWIRTNNGADLNSTADLVTLDNPVALAADGYAMCVMKTDSSVWCWGSGAWGALGQDTSNDPLFRPSHQYVPVRVKP